MGRPTDYTDEILEKAREYLEKYESLGQVVPTIEGFAEHIGITRKTVYEWIKDDEKKPFCDIFEQILQKQALVLVNRGLVGEFNSPMAQMMLSKHGYIKETIQDNKSSDGSAKPNIVFEGVDFGKKD